MGATKTVLIVEDDRSLRWMYASALRMAGFQVRESGDGLAALHEIDHRPVPDCVVLDLGLPVLSGHAVKQELAASAEMREIPVVIVTGSDADVSHLGATCVLRKPVSPESLIETVQRCITSPSRHTERT